MTQSPSSPVQYLADKPVTTSTQDEFKRYGFAKRIAETIRDRKSPESLVVSLYGRWGEGKSSVLNFIAAELKSAKVVTVHFNPWRFEGEDQLLMGFFTELAHALDKPLKTKGEQAGTLIAQYAEAVIPKLQFFGGAVSTEPGAHIKKIAELMSGTSLQELKKRLESLLREARKRVVVIIDDIDRLSKHEVQAIFRLVKLTGDFNYTTYLLSFDDTMVARAIGEMYGGTDAEAAGRNFLEKIIQVPLVLPVIQPENMREFCWQHLQQSIADAGVKLSEDQWARFYDIMAVSIITRISTPRHVARLSNALSFVLPLLKGEANMLDLILAEAMKVLYPELYHIIARNQVFVTGAVYEGGMSKRVISLHGDDNYGKIKATIDGYNEWANGAKSLAAELFPRLADNLALKGLESGMRTEEDLYKSKSIASDSYFKRYFSYAVQKGEISESSLEDLRMKLLSKQPEHALPLATRLLDEGSGKALLYMLTHYIGNQVPEVELIQWVRLLGQISNRFPHTNNPGLRSHTDLARCLTICLAALDSIDLDQRTVLVVEVLQKDGSFIFGYETLYRLWRQIKKAWSQKDDTFMLFPEPIMKQLMHTFIERALKESGDQPLFVFFPHEASFLLLAIWPYAADKVAVQEYIRDILDLHPEHLIKLLEVLADTVSSGNRTWANNMNRATMNYINQTLDLDYLYGQAQLLVGDDNEVLTFPYNDENQPSPETRLRQFIYLYENPEEVTPDDMH